MVHAAWGAAQPWRRRQKSLTALVQQALQKQEQGGSADCTSGNALYKWLANPSTALHEFSEETGFYHDLACHDEFLTESAVGFLLCAHVRPTEAFCRVTSIKNVEYQMKYRLSGAAVSR